MDPEPERNNSAADTRSARKVTSKGEQRRNQILEAIIRLSAAQEDPPTPQDIKEFTGIRSIDVISRHLKILKQEGHIEWDLGSRFVKLVSND